jgi:restriction endonuclease Mrr
MEVRIKEAGQAIGKTGDEGIDGNHQRRLVGS